MFAVCCAVRAVCCLWVVVCCLPCVVDGCCALLSFVVYCCWLLFAVGCLLVVFSGMFVVCLLVVCVDCPMLLVV